MSQLPRLWNSGHRRAVVIAGALLSVAILLGGGLVFWSSARLATSMMNFNVGQQGLSDAQMVAEELTALREGLDRREAVSRALQKAGFLADTDRVAWAEKVSAAARALHPLGYSAEVGVQNWLPLPEDVSTWYATRGLEPPSLHATNLVLHINGLQEDELAGFLHGAMAAGAGVTRIEQCELQRREDDIGVDVECTLRRYGMGVPPAAALAANQAAEVAQ